MTPEPSQQGIDTNNILLSFSSLSYLKEAKDGEEGKLVIAIMNGELVLGVGPKEIEELGGSPRLLNHIDILFSAIKEIFTADREIRDEWLDFVQEDREDKIIAGCFIKFSGLDIELIGESKKYGPIPDGIFLDNPDSLYLIYEMVREYRLGE